MAWCTEHTPSSTSLKSEDDDSSSQREESRALVGLARPGCDKQGPWTAADEATYQLAVGADGAPLTRQRAWLAARVGLNAAVREALRLRLLGPDDRNDEGDSLLHVAAATGNEPLLQHLLQMGVAVGHANDAGERPLFLAAAHGHAGCARTLLLHAAPVNAVNLSGETALYIAAYRGQLDLVRLLLASPGVDASRPSDEGATPLDVAGYYQHQAVAVALRAHLRWQRVRLLWLAHLRNPHSSPARLPRALVAYIAQLAGC